MEHGWAVVTGASSGIGRAFARRLARDGYPVLAVARRAERLSALIGDLAASGGVAVWLQADLRTREGRNAVVERTMALGPVELLVNNAASGEYGGFGEHAVERELGMVDLNVAALVELTHRFLPEIRRHGRGGVINLASGLAFQPVPYFSTYAATKAFVLSFTEGLAHEVRNTDIRVLAVCPGPVRTEFADMASTTADARRFVGSIPNLTPEAVVEAALQAFRRGRVVQVVGLANHVLTFLPRMLPRSMVRRVMGGLAQPPMVAPSRSDDVERQLGAAR